jgi:uncharacterized membrane protein
MARPAGSTAAVVVNPAVAAFQLAAVVTLAVVVTLIVVVILVWLAILVVAMLRSHPGRGRGGPLPRLARPADRES